MENTDSVSVPIQLSKIKAPGQSCFVKLAGPDASPISAGNVGAMNTPAFAIVGTDVYTFDGSQILQNGQPTGADDPGTAFAQAMETDLYLLSAGGVLYVYDTTQPAQNPVLAAGFSAVDTPLAMDVSAVAVWILFSSGSTRSISTWNLETHAQLTIPLSGSGLQTPTISALCAVDLGFYIADATAVWKISLENGLGICSSVLPLPSGWGSLAGMVGRCIYHNDGGEPAYTSYLYVVTEATGSAYCVYPDFGEWTSVGQVTARSGSTTYGTLRLDEDGLLYYVTLLGPSGISKLNPLVGNTTFLMGPSGAYIGVTVLPNTAFALGDSLHPSTLTYSSDRAGDQVLGISTVYYTDAASRGYDKTIYCNGSALKIHNPTGILNGPALRLNLKTETDGIVIIGDIDIDPLKALHLRPSHPIHHD